MKYQNNIDDLKGKINFLQENLEQTKGEYLFYDNSKETLADIVRLNIESLGEKFKRLIIQCQKHYHKSKLNLKDAFLMWFGNKIERNKNTYTADRSNGDLLENGKIALQEKQITKGKGLKI